MLASAMLRERFFRVPDDEGLRRVGFIGEQEEDETIIPYEDNVSALVYGQNEILIVNDYANHPLAVGFHALRGIASVIGVPVVSKRNRWLGCCNG